HASIPPRISRGGRTGLSRVGADDTDPRPGGEGPALRPWSIGPGSAREEGKLMARIVVIEDEVDLCHVIEFNLIQAGHEVRVADNGRTGLGLIQSFKPDIALLDIMLPEMSGLEVCRQLKSAPETKGILVV